MTTSDLPIKGYILYMDDGLEGDFSIIYDGRLNSLQTSHLATGLVAGRTYNFKVKSVDINGLGPDSAVVSFVSCVPPAHMSKPTLEAVDQTSFTISWDLPQDEGGCQITGYAIYRDDGNGGMINIPVDAAVVAN